MRTISNRDKIIDSRDVIRRLEELQGEREDLDAAMLEAQEAFTAATESLAEWDDENGEDHEGREDLQTAADDAQEALTTAAGELTEWDDENGGELTALQNLNDEGEGCADWSYGATLIRDDHFQDYARELADDLGLLENEVWPYNHIDWEAAADALKADYAQVDFDGETYWVRA